MLPHGKVPPDVLERIISLLPPLGKGVLIGPGSGIDATAIEFGEKVLVVSTDPITGAEKGIGFYAVHVNANDVATFGARPRWLLVTLLLPENSDEDVPVGIMKEISETARGLEISIVGGHTEVTPGLKRPIVIGTMMGEVERGTLVLPKPRPGDAIIMTKWAGLEGTSIIAGEREEELKGAFGQDFVEKARSLGVYLSVLDEAMLLREFANAMHDPTEGGVANGLHEMADVENLGFRIYKERIPIREETKRICDFYGLDPLSLISSGSLLAAVPRDNARFLVERLLSRGINAAVIGEFLAERKRVIVVNGDERPLKRPERDEIWKIMS